MTRVHVNTVLKGGPAEEAGLRAGEDYILGSERISLAAEEATREVLGGAEFTLGIAAPAELLAPQML